MSFLFRQHPLLQKHLKTTSAFGSFESHSFPQQAPKTMPNGVRMFSRNAHTVVKVKLRSETQGSSGGGGVRGSSRQLKGSFQCPAPFLDTTGFFTDRVLMLVNTLFFKLWRKDGRRISLPHPSAPGFRLQSAKNQKAQLKNISRS